MKCTQIGIFVSAITASGLALADCPENMPLQLLQDCIVYEGAGSNFPSDDYAYLNLYNDWLAEQRKMIVKKTGPAD
jgi:hypothetical protein